MCGRSWGGWGGYPFKPKSVDTLFTPTAKGLVGLAANALVFRTTIVCLVAQGTMADRAF